MMHRTKPYFVAGLSGFVWAFIAYVITYTFTGPTESRVLHAVAGAGTIAPAIGILIGSISRHFVSYGVVQRSAIALFDLYLAALLFLWASGIDPVPGLVVSITLSGYVIVLWPLSYANHVLVSRV